MQLCLNYAIPINIQCDTSHSQSVLFFTKIISEYYVIGYNINGNISTVHPYWEGLANHLHSWIYFRWQNILLLV